MKFKELSMYVLADFENMTKNELKKLLTTASDSYYNTAESIISDEEFDIGFKLFSMKYPNDNLTKQIGAKIKTSEWKKALHKIRMCSLNKAQNIDSMSLWINLMEFLSTLNMKMEN
jgi:NAD-dependent DNA ligase